MSVASPEEGPPADVGLSPKVMAKIWCRRPEEPVAPEPVAGTEPAEAPAPVALIGGGEGVAAVTVAAVPTPEPLPAPLPGTDAGLD